MADQVIVERDRDEVREPHGSNTGMIVGIIAIVLLVLLALFVLPSLLGGGAGNTGTSTSAPAPATGTGQ